MLALFAVVAADAGHRAAAQGRLEAQYTASISGIPIGRGNWIIEIANDQYTAAASGTTTGLIKFFTGAHGTGAAHGTMPAGQPTPTSYGATITYDHKVDDVRMALAGGNVTDYAAEPPLPPAPDRIPVTDADRHGVFDPMTSMLNRVPGTGDPVTPQACNRTVPVFDGRVRYDLRSEFRRMETVKADRGYAGPAVLLADFRICPGSAGDQISGDLARRRSVAGADRRHSRAGTVPFLDADAARHRAVAGDRICLGRTAVAPYGGKDGMIVAGATWPARPQRRVPVIHRMMTLDSAWNHDCRNR
jgi:hypothetical protein